MTIQSTVPGAISAVAGYLAAVAAANPSLDVATYIGPPIETVANRFMAIGAYPNFDELVVGYRSDWAAMPATSRWVSEEYEVAGCLRTWAGNSDPQSRLTEAFTLLNGLREQILLDPGGGGALSPSGSWGTFTTGMAHSGPIGGQGWGIVLTFQIQVINVRIQG